MGVIVTHAAADAKSASREEDARLERSQLALRMDSITRVGYRSGIATLGRGDPARSA
jgi:hypothetical protein